MKKNYLFALLFALITGEGLLAQQPTDKAELEREKKEIQDELRQLQSMYDNVKGQKKQSLGQWNMINRKITLQERYINAINKDLKLIDDDIYTSNLEIYRLEKQLDTLKSQYARTVVYSYKNRSSFDYVNFIFSASSFNDAMRRISYLKSYRAYREKQVDIIHNTQELIARRQQQQLARKKEKSEALQEQNKERSKLTDQRKEKDEVLSKIKSQEKDLQKQIATKRKRDRDLKNAIAAIVRREIETAKKEEEARIAAAKKAAAEEKAKNPAASAPSSTPKTTTAPPTADVTPKKTVSYLELNASDIKLGSSFAESRGKLPWPVDQGFVKIPFGKFTIDNIVGDNPGLTIGTPVGSVVKSVFDGDVVAIHNYGDGVAVVIRHGKYFTSYSNLSGVSVAKGASVKRGQQIGRAGESDDDSGGQVEFMLMIERNNVNPAQWLSRK